MMNLSQKLRNWSILVCSVTLGIILQKCTNDIPVDYSNPFDPQSKNFIPYAPFKLSATIISDTCISLIWSDTNRVVDKFLVERKIGDNTEYNFVGETVSAINAYKDFLAVKTGISYHYRIAPIAHGNQGNFSNETDDSIAFSISASPRIISTSNESLTIFWSNSQNFPGIFQLERSINQGLYFQIGKVATDSIMLFDNDIDTSNIYSYRIKAVTRYNETQYSPSSSIQFRIDTIERVTSVNLGSPVHSTAFNHDGTLFAAAGATYSLKVWDATGGNLIRNFVLGTKGFASLGWPFQVAFSSDGKFIASNGDGSSNAKINIWKLNDGALLKTIHGEGGDDARSIEFTPDGTGIVTGNFNGVLRKWIIANDSLIAEKKIFSQDEIPFIRYSKNGTQIIVGSAYDDLKILNSTDWSVYANLNNFHSRAYSVSDDEQYCTFGGSVGSLSDGSIVKTLPGFPVNSVLSFDNKYIIGRADGTIMIGLVSDGSIRLVLPLSLSNAYTYPSVACSPHLYEFITNGQSDGTLDLWVIKQSWQTIN